MCDTRVPHVFAGDLDTELCTGASRLPTGIDDTPRPLIHSWFVREMPFAEFVEVVSSLVRNGVGCNVDLLFLCGGLGGTPVGRP